MRKAKEKAKTEIMKIVVMNRKGESLKMLFTQNMKLWSAPYRVQILSLRGLMYLLWMKMEVAK